MDKIMTHEEETLIRVAEIIRNPGRGKEPEVPQALMDLASYASNRVAGRSELILKDARMTLAEWNRLFSIVKEETQSVLYALAFRSRK
jgi:hypothetical protein